MRKLNNVTGVLLDRTGNLYLSETNGQRVRKVSPDGIITTVAGNGTAGFSGDGRASHQRSTVRPGWSGAGYRRQPVHCGCVQQSGSHGHA